MKFTLDQRTKLDDLIDQHEGEAFSREAVIDEFADFMRNEEAGGNLPDIWHDLAVGAVDRHLRQRAWRVEQNEQMAMFDGDALLAMGEDEYVHMKDARAEHVLRHMGVLDENMRRTAAAHFAKTAYLQSRLPVLFDTGDTLADIEAQFGDGE